MRKHIPKQCDISGCTDEATYWIDTSEGFVERLLRTSQAPDTFYICLDHQYELNGQYENDGNYVHLRIDTGEITGHEIGKYACHPECEVCAE